MANETISSPIVSAGQTRDPETIKPLKHLPTQAGNHETLEDHGETAAYQLSLNGLKELQRRWENFRGSDEDKAGEASEASSDLTDFSGFSGFSDDENNDVTSEDDTMVTACENVSSSSMIMHPKGDIMSAI